MRYVVTGATGFIGGRVARRLVEAGHRVVAIARDPARAGSLVELGVEVRPGDVTDRESMRPAFEGADGVFHVAGWYRVGARDTSPARRINVDGTRNVLELMRESGIAKGVYTSTIAVFSDTRGRVVDETYRYDGPHLSEYDRTKWAAHYRVAEPMMRDGLPLVIVQPGIVYGPGDAGPMRDTFVQYLRRRLPLVPKGSAFCWAHVEDTARGHLLAMERGRAGESYVVGGPPWTLAAVLDLAEWITGIKAPRFRPGPGVMGALASAMGVVGRAVPLPEQYTPETLRVAAGVTYLGSDAKARRELGFETRPLEEGLRETLRHEMRLLGMRA